jgi:hypothetical protein
MRKFLKISIVLLLWCSVSNAQSITASPGWSYSVTSGTVSEAGSDYSISPTSSTNQTLVSITGLAVFGDTYTVSVNKLDSDWNNSLSLQVIRTGAGTAGGFGGGSITGGLSYITLTNINQVFFSGTTGFLSGSRNNVPIQYRITGASVLLPVKTYTTTIVYTFSD